MKHTTTTSGEPNDGSDGTDDAVHTIATGPAPGAAMSGLPTVDGDADSAAVKPLGGPALRPAAVFSHDMVLQRRRPIPVFGTGTPGRAVIVTLRAAGAADTALDAPGVGADGMTDGADDPTAPGTPSVITLAGASPTRRTTTDRLVASTVIDADGRWIVRLPAIEAGGPYELAVTDRSGITLVYRNVVAGEVWLAGGQSNMELELRNAADADAAIAASADPLLRFYNTPKTGVVDEDAEDHARWRVADPSCVGTMSAVAYHMARRLRGRLDPAVPVGVIDCYIGGTSLTAWMSHAALEGCAAGRAYLDRFSEAIAGKTDDQFAAETDAWQTRFDRWNDDIAAARAADPDVTWDTLNATYGECPWPPPVTPTSQWRPTGAYVTMLSRVAPYALAGFLWYQGEEDDPHCDTYRELLGLMIGEWRGLWDDTTLPFLIVQLPQWIDKATAAAGTDPRRWPVLREAQWDAARTIDDVHTITTIDCGEFDNIHPTDKRTPGERLADCALNRVYGRFDIPVDGPQPESVEFVAAGTGAETTGGAVIRFAHADGLRFDGTVPGTYRRGDCEGGSPLHRDADGSGFEVAGDDDAWRPADATIVADGTIRVCCDGVPSPVAVRYAWHSWGPAPLFNAAGLPAAPFRR